MSLEEQLVKLNTNLDRIATAFEAMTAAAGAQQAAKPEVFEMFVDPDTPKPAAKADKPGKAATTKPAADKSKASSPTPQEVVDDPGLNRGGAATAPAEASADPSVTFQDLVKALKNVAVAWMKIPGEDHVKRSADLFTGFGITKLMELPQEQWEAFMMKAAESAAEAEELAAA